MKEGIRVLGIDDAPSKRTDEQTFLTGVVYRGTEFIEDIQTESIRVDGEGATKKVLSLYRKCNNPRQIKVVLVDGISFAGFNIVDIEKVSENIGKPVIAVTSNKPNKDNFRRAMKHSATMMSGLKVLTHIQKSSWRMGNVSSSLGCSKDEAKNFVRNSVIHGLVPEPIRVAHMIGRGMRFRD